MTAARRDYSLTGPSSVEAKARGLADAEWYRAPVAPERLQALGRRTNGRAARDVLLWLGLLAVTGTAAAIVFPSWWSVPLFLVYGALYGGAADSRWHECGHGTAFASTRANDLVYPLASFMVLRNPTQWRWSHVRHHTDTIIVGRDAEISFPRPTSLWSLAGSFLYWKPAVLSVRALVTQAVGRVSPDVCDQVPVDEQPKVVRDARVAVAVLAAAVIAALATRSWLPVLLVGLPSVYGAWLMVFFGVTQHFGLREDVLDHRLNTRSVRMNPVFRFLYLNMNYHVEHHMFPTVPYHALPALHAEVAPHLAPIMPNVRSVYREVVLAARRQHADPTWEIPDRGVPVDGPAARGDTAVEITVVDGGSVDLGPSTALARGDVRRIDIGEQTYVLCRAGDGSLALIDGWCTHGHAHLADGVLRGGAIECPKHNGRFDLATGAASRRPARVPLTVHTVRDRDGRIVAHPPIAAATAAGEEQP